MVLLLRVLLSGQSFLDPFLNQKDLQTLIAIENIFNLSPFKKGQKDKRTALNARCIDTYIYTWHLGQSFCPFVKGLSKGQKDCPKCQVYNYLYIHLAFRAVLLSFYKRIKGLPLLFKAPNPPPLSNPHIQEDEPDNVTQTKHSINCHY